MEGYVLPSTDPLGTDIKLDDNGDLVVDVSGSLKTVTGADNVNQAVRVNLMTNPYMYLFDGNVGTELAAFIDEPITADIEKEITTMVTNTISNDDRILSVSNVTIDDSQTDKLVLFISALVNDEEITIPVTIGGA